MISDPRQLVQSLRAGGYNIVVRHGATYTNQADTDPFNFDDVSKQRNLNDKGKELAKAFGDAIRRVGVPVGEVYTSKFNRAYETAVQAGFEDIEKTIDLTEGGLAVLDRAEIHGQRIPMVTLAGEHDAEVVERPAQVVLGLGVVGELADEALAEGQRLCRLNEAARAVRKFFEVHGASLGLVSPPLARKEHRQWGFGFRP